jgi:WD40 repeat protein
MPKRLIIFLVVALFCGVGVGAYFHHVKTRTALPAAVRSSPFTETASSRIYFRYTGVDENYGKLAFVSLTNLSSPQFVSALSCEVVYFANGSGVCLQANRGILTTYAATLFDSNFATRATFPLHGGPSRARISPDGKIAGFTVFLSGHGYASLNFSTETLLVDTARGKVIASLENDVRVLRDRKPFQAKDFNFWGVTFTPDSKNFYCTLSSGGAHYLIKGNIAERTAVVVHDNVECPSVSPDGTRVAYKKRSITDGRLVWQLHVLDLATQHETPLAEKRSLDDQIEWLDNDHVLYTVSDKPEGSSGTTNVWKADAAGTGTPAIFLPKAYSPSVVR